MKQPPHSVIEVFLQPGEFFFGDADTRIRTLLGSCVAITVWHPRLRVGGMCHFLLPSRGRVANPDLDGRYADEALQLFLRETRALSTRPAEYQTKVFGAGSMFPGIGRRESDTAKNTDVPSRNARAAIKLLVHHGFSVTAKHIGGEGHRNVIFDVWSGDVWCRHRELSPSSNLLDGTCP